MLVIRVECNLVSFVCSCGKGLRNEQFWRSVRAGHYEVTGRAQ